MKWHALFLLLGLSLIAHSALAQIAADPKDVGTIDGIMKAYYEVVSGPAGGVSDVARDHTLHHPDAWIGIGGLNPEGKPVVRTMNLDGYYANDAPRKEGFWEWETDRIVHRNGNMASVWSSYASAREEGGEPFTRGVNSLTLYYDGIRWWIMTWMYDTSAE